MLELILAFALGVSCTLLGQTVVIAWRLSYVLPKEKPVDIVDEENVVRIERWKERRQKTDETFGRWA